ncbi:protein SPO16 homolog [Antedon mediterranea]|uniref:protein SPO16 homolog n=1 Tax=Antedon mediterranea TaxID=105859 RepID=UPI003AF6EBCD
MAKHSIDPVIINTSLADCDIFRCLQKQYKVRLSESTPKDTCIFPLSTVTFLLIRADDASTITQQPNSGQQVDLLLQMIGRLKQLQSGHQNCYLILSSALHEQRELSIMFALQNSVFASKMKILPSHSDSETAKIMAMIAKAKGKHASGIFKQRLDTLATRHVDDAMILRSLSAIGLTDHQCFVLQQGCGSLLNIVNATKQQLLDHTSLASETAEKIVNFFSAET